MIKARLLICEAFDLASQIGNEKSGASLADGQSDTLPQSLRIIPWGRSETRKGPVLVDNAVAAALPAAQSRNKRDRVAIDFQHSTVPGTPHYRGEPQKVAGYGTVDVRPGQGVYLSAIEWTPEGREHAAAGHYPDISPAIIQGEDGSVLAIHSVGLVRQGEIDGLTLFSADASLVGYSAEDTTDKPTTTMDYKNLLCTLLGLQADATDEQITAAATKQGEAAKTMSAELDKITTLSADLAAMKARLDSIESGATTDRRQAIVDRAIAEGKVIPLSAEQIAALPIETFSALVDGLPSTVPVERRTPKKIVEFSAGLGTETYADQVRTNLQISKETWDKHNKAS